MVLHSRVLSFSFVLLLFLQLKVVHRVVEVVLEVIEVDHGEHVVEDTGLLSWGVYVFSAMLYLRDLR